jgi:hypothetical protein
MRISLFGGCCAELLLAGVISSRPQDLCFVQDAVRLMLEDQVDEAIAAPFSVVDAEALSLHSAWQVSPPIAATVNADGKVWLLAVGDFGHRNARTEEVANAMVRVGLPFYCLLPISLCLSFLVCL